MRNRDYFLPSVTTLVIFGLAWFLSCAHQNRMQDEADAGFEQTAEAPAESETTQNEVATNEESQATPPAEQAQQESPAEPETALAPKEESVEAQAEAQTEVPPVANSEESNSVQNPEVTQNEAPLTEEPQLVEAPVETPKAQIAWVGVVPKIPSKAVKRKGKSLNRFYFARKGDTPKSVSELIYSDKKHSKLLTSWNGKNWQPGKILYYSSPMDPADKKMRSFYQERKVVPEEYTVSAGDWLTRIASKKLGSSRSWKEIAVVNGLKQPNDLEVGQLLAIYPLDLLASPAPQQEKVVRNDSVSNLPMIEKPAPQPQEAQPEPLMPQDQPLAQAPAPEMAPSPAEPSQAQVPQQEPAPVMNAEAPQSEAPATNWDQVVEQNFVAILIGAAVVILLLVLAARKKKQKLQASASNESAQEEFTENTPSKFRKR